MKKFFLFFFLLLILTPQPTHAAVLRSKEFVLESGITPTPSPFQSKISRDENNVLRISLSSDTISFGPLSATNPVKRKLTVSTDGNTSSILLVSENHPLQAAPFDKGAAQEIADTTCDQGTCTEKTVSEWINPFTFGLGFSLDDKFYRQFPDSSKKESPLEIGPGTLFVKLNVNQAQVLASKNYKNTITFIAIPKL